MRFPGRALFRFRLGRVKNVIILIFLLSAPLFAVDVVTVDGRSIKGERLNVTKGVLSVDTEKFPLEEVITCRWDRDSDMGLGKGEFMFSLVNGDRIRGSIAKVSQENLTISSRSFGNVEIEQKNIFNIRFASGNIKKAKESEYTKTNEKDTVIFANGDSLNGKVAGISTTGVVLESVVGRMHYKFSDLFLIKFNKAVSSGSSVQGAFFRLVTTHGESISGREILQNNDAVTIYSFMAGKISVSESGLSLLKVVNGRFIYLSDIAPSDAEERAYWKGGYTWHFKKDKSIDGNTIRLNKKEYAKGLGVHSYCRLQYRLNRTFSSFVAYVGIDDEVTEYGNVDIVITGDGKTLFEKKAIDVKSGPVHVSVDVSSVDTLELIVNFGELFDIGDHVDWAGAYLIRKKE